MDVVLCYNQSSLLFNISPYMPISYLRKLASKTFKIPDFALNLIYEDKKITKQYNEQSLKDYFGNITTIIIKINENETQINIQQLLTTTRSIQNKKIVKNIETIEPFSKKEIKFPINNIPQKILKRRNKSDFSIGQNNTISYFEKDNCQECLKNSVIFYCRDDNSFLCQNCKNKKHLKHKIINVEKNNIEQCFYIYQKILIEQLKEQEDIIYKLSFKERNHEDKKKTEELIQLLQKIFDKEQKILNFYPSLPLEIFLEKNYTEIKRNIFDLKDKVENKNLYSYKDKLEAFNSLQIKDMEIRDNQIDINAIKTKIHFSQVIISVIESIKNSLLKVYNDMKQILNENKINPIGLALDLKKFMIKQEQNFDFEIDEIKENEINENDEEFEEFLRKTKYNRIISDNNLSNNIQKLPLLKTFSNQSITNSIDSSKYDSTSTQNLKTEILKLDLKSDYSHSSDEKSKKEKNNFSPINSSHTIKNKSSILPFQKINNRSRNNTKIINKDEFRIKNISDGKLSRALLNDDGSEKISDIKKKSIRLSVFLQNKNKINSSIGFMKVKKKKKKH
jgi:hypothetical protein